MAKTSIPNTPLGFIEIVMRAEADTIRAALEARLKVDALLAERAEAYRKIAEFENQVEEIIGEPGVFAFPAPPLPVAAFSKVVVPPPAKKSDAPRPHKANEGTAPDVKA